MNSCFYVGRVHHRRTAPVEHEFHYRVFQIYLDLSELDLVFSRRWFWSTRRFNWAWFRRQDHFGEPTQSLDESVRRHVHEKLGRRPSGPIHLLTHLRYLGYVMNPVSFFYCFHEDGETLDAIVAEVHNTPWGERHCYVVDASKPASQTVTAQLIKEFHVSPFMPMDLQYRWEFSKPTNDLRVRMVNLQRDHGFFEASLHLVRKPLDGRSAAVLLMVHPWMTAKVILAIYWQAFWLWAKRVPIFPHKKLKTAASESQG